MDHATRIFDRLLEITLLLQKDLASSFERSGLTLARTHLLWELNRLGTTNQRSLAEALDVSARNVTGLVDALEETGFVARAPDPNDRRATLVALTDLGARTMSDMERDRLGLSHALLDGIPEDQVQQTALGLDAITERLRALIDASRRPGW